MSETNEATYGPESDSTSETDTSTGDDVNAALEADAHLASSTPEDADTESDTFPREYVQKLRTESAKYRERAKQADDLARRLHRSLVEQDGRLADAGDLTYNDAHLEDSEALSQAITDLLESKPHYASRKLPSADVGQGVRGGSSGAVSWADVIKQG